MLRTRTAARRLQRGRGMRGVLLVVAVGGCVGFPDRNGPLEVSKVERKALPIGAPRAIDALFVVDTAPTMTSEQEVIAVQMRSIANALEQVEGGASLHVGFVSSDLGTLGVDVSDPRCAGAGDDGRFQGASGCAVAGDFLIRDYDLYGNELRNYAGTTIDAIACMGAGLGADGCRFRQPLEAMRRALERGQANGFLRRYAELVVVFLGDADDCTAADPRFFAAADPFRCFADGVVCDGDDPTRLGEHTGCRPREGGMLAAVDDYASYLRGLKADADDLRVGAVTGPPLVVVESGPRLASSCIAGAQEATPGIRLAAFASRFPDRFLTTSTCGDWSNAAALFSDLIWPIIGYPCFESVLADADPEAPGLQPDCAAWFVLEDGAEVVVPACDAGRDGTWCYRLARDAVNCSTTPTQLALQLDPPGVLEPVQLVAECVAE